MSIAENLSQIHQQIQQISEQYQRDNVRLLAVSKTKPVEAIQAAIEAGQRAFGENYVQEAVEKIEFFANRPELEWHFIGPLQSNKTKLVAAYFDWIQTVDRLKIAERLNEQRPADKAPLNVLIQINISDEASKSGIEPDEMLPLAQAISQLPNLKLRGLMAIPKPESEPEQQKLPFAKCSYFLTACKQNLTTLIPFQWGCRTICKRRLNVARQWCGLGLRFLGRDVSQLSFYIKLIQAVKFAKNFANSTACFVANSGKSLYNYAS